MGGGPSPQLRTSAPVPLWKPIAEKDNSYRRVAHRANAMNNNSNRAGGCVLVSRRANSAACRRTEAPNVTAGQDAFAGHCHGTNAERGLWVVQRLDDCR